MTKEEWLEAEKQAISRYGGCKLRVDGYNITILLQPESAYKSSLVVYVDDKFKGAWLIEDCEERRRFCRPITKSVLNLKKDKEILKGMNKKQQEVWRKKAQYTYYSPYWNSFGSLKRHLIANNNSIELLH